MNREPTHIQPGPLCQVGSQGPPLQVSLRVSSQTCGPPCPGQLSPAQPASPLSVIWLSIHHSDQTKTDKGQSDAFDPAKRQPPQQLVPTQRRPQDPPEFLDRVFGFPGWLSTRKLRRRQNPERGAQQQGGAERGTWSPWGLGFHPSTPAHSSLAGASSLGKEFTPELQLPHLQNGSNNPYAWGPVLRESYIPASGP